MPDCPVCLRPRNWHDDCLLLVISWRLAGQYDIVAQGLMVRRLAPVCYLCGVSPSEEAEHIHPARWGGLATWGNMAGACTRCNRIKWDRVGYLTTEQLARAEEQQAIFQATFNRCSDAVVIDGLAARTRRYARRCGDPELDVEELARELTYWFDETGAPLERVIGLVTAALELMASRGWVELAPAVDIAYEVADAYTPNVTADD